MDRGTKLARLKSMLVQVAPEGALERMRVRERAPADSEETPMAQPPGLRETPRARETAASGLAKLQTGRDTEIDDEEMRGLEAIVMLENRPVFFVRNGSYADLPAPWSQLNAAPARAAVESVIASVGRIELPRQPQIPYGGTGFLVGPGLMMTNRHVAEIFVEGLGVTRLRFNRGDAAVDFRREVDTPEDERSAWFSVLDVVMVHPYWDMALLKVDGPAAEFRPLTLSTAHPEDLLDADIVALGYPARDDRSDLAVQDRIFERRYNVKRMQPGKLRKRARILSFENTVDAVTHDSSTLGGNSGSAIMDPGTGLIVGLHFAGLYLRANYAVPTYELARDRRVVDAGVNFAGSVAATGDWDDAWRSSAGGESASAARTGGTAGVLAGVDSGSSTWTIPLQITVSMGQPARAGADAGQAAAAAVESMQIPIIYDGLEERGGYDPDFLGLGGQQVVPLPALTAQGKRAAAPLDDGSVELKYHRFSVVMHKGRRLAMFTVSNVDWRAASRLIDGKKPNRKQLTGLPDGAIEQWVTDGRIDDAHQLPDIFYTKDGGAFDKGHLVRRDDVVWGATFEDMQMGNGDTYHTTNCSPQVKEFNQSAQGVDNWGDLENLVQKQTSAEKAIILSGPVLASDDRLFEGRGESGKILLRVPRRFWKIIVVKGDAAPEAFGFVLEQDLSKVPFHEEFVVPAAWRRYMSRIADIEKLLHGLATLASLKPFDQFGNSEAVRISEGLI